MYYDTPILVSEEMQRVISENDDMLSMHLLVHYISVSQNSYKTFFLKLFFTHMLLLLSKINVN